METIVRNTNQVGAAIRRHRKQLNLTQDDLGQRMRIRQATVSKLESGEPATQLRVFMEALAALNLELVVRQRTKGSIDDIESLF